jgi:hypothetical protein
MTATDNAQARDSASFASSLKAQFGFLLAALVVALMSF